MNELVKTYPDENILLKRNSFEDNCSKCGEELLELSTNTTNYCFHCGELN